MKNRGISVTPEQVGEVMPPILAEVLALPSQRMQYWIGRKTELAREIRKVLVGEEIIANNEPTDIRGEWKEFYREELSMDVDLADVKIPDDPGGFDRVIVVAKNLTIAQIVATCRKHFKVWPYRDDLGEAVTENERTPVSSYAIRVRDRDEADEELKNLSANKIRAMNLKTETLLERSVHELKYFKETGKHLDVDNLTLCAGSRFDDGGVPGVRWSYGSVRLWVSWCGTDDRFNDLRPRAVSV